MDLKTDFRVGMQGDKWEGCSAMFEAILGAASAIALGSPAVAADLSVPPYSEVPGYEGSYEYGTTPPIVEEPPPAVFVRPPFIVAPPPATMAAMPPTGRSVTAVAPASAGI